METPTQQSIGHAETQASTSDSAPQPAIQLTSKQKQVLGAFRESQEVGGKDLAAQLGVSAPTVSRRLKELEALGLVMKSGQKYELTQQGARELANLIDKGM